MASKCAMPGCGKPASLQCPTCLKMQLDNTYFCGQDCFKTAWGIHKLVHVSPEQSKKKKQSGYKFSGPLRPGKVSPKLPIPEHIEKPDYYYTGYPKKQIQSNYQKQIQVCDSKTIEAIREVGLLGRQTLDFGHKLVKAGVTTDQIDKKVHEFIINNGGYPSPYNYHKFPKSLCTSVNQVICHGIPDDRPLETGDIVNLDVSVFKKGVHIDLNQTYFVGEVSESSRYLVQKSYNCLQKALEICKPGTMYREVGNIISKYIQENGLAVNRTYCGHGTGPLFHSAPNVPHYAGNKTAGFMKEGHVFTIEPMINAGTHKDITWPDEWTAVTADGQRSSQFQHTILITQTGYELLSGRLPQSPALQFQL